MGQARRPAASKAAVIVAADALKRFSKEVFMRAGMLDDHAGITADVLVWADLRGVDSHGVTRIPRYVGLIRAGDMNPKPAMTVRTETAASVLIDGDRAAGPVAMTWAMGQAVQKAKGSGVGLALVRATTHTAALGYYTQMGARQGMVAITCAGSGPNTAYHGARAAGISSSPISIAVPGGHDGPVVLDMGTGVVAVGKLIQARKTGRAIPEGWALDRNGNPATDPQATQTPLPLGGPKGSGLSLMIECITSLIVAKPILAEALESGAGRRRHRQNGLAIAIDIARFCDPTTFQREVGRLVKAAKGLPRAPGVDEILAPGERGNRILKQRSRDGIPIARATFDELKRLAERLGVPMFSWAPRP